MVIKKLILLFIILSVLISGCLDSGEDQEQEGDDDSGGAGGTSGGTQWPDEMQTPEEAVTSEEMGTPVEAETFEEIETPEETGETEEMEIAEEMLTPGGANGFDGGQIENVTGEGEEEVGVVQPAETEPRTYLARLRDYTIIPSELEINTGDTVVWRNFEESSVFTLRSEEGLFEDQRLGYGNTVNYTFSENGSYSFDVREYPSMQMTITVK